MLQLKMNELSIEKIFEDRQIDDKWLNASRADFLPASMLFNMEKALTSCQHPPSHSPLLPCPHLNTANPSFPTRWTIRSVPNHILLNIFIDNLVNKLIFSLFDNNI